jgi:chromosome partitioning protein
VWAADEVVKLVNEAKVYKEKLKCVFVINRKIANTAIGRDVRDALSAYPVPVMQATLTQRVIFAEAAARGLSVGEADPGGTAETEVKAMLDELKGYVA